MPFDTPFADYVEPLLHLCRESARCIMTHYASAEASEHDIKTDSSPLTAADLASHRILVEGLRPFGLPVLSEESNAGVREQARHWQRYWLVDPLDGTKEFLGRTGEFTINIALVENGKAVFGVVATPVSQEIYLGIPGEGAWRYNWGRANENWQAITCRPLVVSRPTLVLTSRRHRGDKLDTCLAHLRADVGQVERAYVGSALKFCQLAAGEADFYPRFSPCSEWDTAAGQALLEGAGGAIFDLRGKPLCYNQGESLLNPHFFAVGDPGAGVWSGLLDLE